MPDESLPTLAGTAAEERVTPASIAGVCDGVRAARSDRAPLRIAGAGTWLDAGGPVEATRTMDLTAVSGIVEYIPGDLTLTARAGTPLTEIAEATRAHRQWLPLDAFGSARGTLGATVATASAGPLAGSLGTPRDVTVGLSFVSGEGAVVQGGGRVVKNVAGFDLVRLTIGAWGTLGVIVEATVRLRARPEADETVALPLPDERDALAALLSNVRQAPVEPLAAELLSAAAANRLAIGAGALLLVRVAGNAVGVHHQVAALKRLAACQPVDPDIWRRIGLSDPPGAFVVRVSRRPSELPRLWGIVSADATLDAHASLARGIVRIRCTEPRQATVLDAFDVADHRVYETVPWGSRVAVLPPDPNAAISQRLRMAFDPDRILNRGIMGSSS